MKHSNHTFEILITLYVYNLNFYAMFWFVGIVVNITSKIFLTYVYGYVYLEFVHYLLWFCC